MVLKSACFQHRKSPDNCLSVDTLWLKRFPTCLLHMQAKQNLIKLGSVHVWRNINKERNNNCSFTHSVVQLQTGSATWPATVVPAEFKFILPADSFELCSFIYFIFSLSFELCTPKAGLHSQSKHDLRRTGHKSRDPLEAALSRGEIHNGPEICRNFYADNCTSVKSQNLRITWCTQHKTCRDEFCQKWAEKTWLEERYPIYFGSVHCPCGLYFSSRYYFGWTVFLQKQSGNKVLGWAIIGGHGWIATQPFLQSDMTDNSFHLDLVPLTHNTTRKGVPHSWVFKGRAWTLGNNSSHCWGVHLWCQIMDVDPADCESQQQCQLNLASKFSGVSLSRSWDSEFVAVWSRSISTLRPASNLLTLLVFNLFTYPARCSAFHKSTLLWAQTRSSFANIDLPTCTKWPAEQFLLTLLLSCVHCESICPD